MPVFTSNEDYRDGGAAPPDERAALQSVFQQGYKKGLSVGSVHAYVIAPDGELTGSLHTAEAAKPEKLIGLLEQAVATLKTPAGKPVVQASAPAKPDCPPNSLRLHLIARYLERRGDDFVLTEDPSGGWAAVPGTDWICVSRDEWRSLIPPSLKSGSKWSIAPGLSRSLMVHCYPPSENNDLTKNRIERGELQASLESVSGGQATVRIEGSMRMQHDFYHKPDGRFVEASLVGYAKVDMKSKAVTRFQLVSDRAHYFDSEGKHAQPFGVAVRLVP